MPNIKQSPAKSPAKTEAVTQVTTCMKPTPEMQEWNRKLAERAAVERENLTDAIDPRSPDALSDEDMESLGNFLLIVRNHYGNAGTPVEDCIVGIARRYRDGFLSGDGLTPDGIAHIVNDDSEDGFRAYFDEAVEIARRFNARYPKVLTALADDKAVV
jgi:hypothetical protein